MVRKHPNKDRQKDRQKERIKDIQKDRQTNILTDRWTKSGQDYGTLSRIRLFTFGAQSSLVMDHFTPSLKTFAKKY